MFHTFSIMAVYMSRMNRRNCTCVAAEMCDAAAPRLIAHTKSQRTRDRFAPLQSTAQAAMFPIRGRRKSSRRNIKTEASSRRQLRLRPQTSFVTLIISRCDAKTEWNRAVTRFPPPIQSRFRRRARFSGSHSFAQIGPSVFALRRAFSHHSNRSIVT